MSEGFAVKLALVSDHYLSLDGTVEDNIDTCREEFSGMKDLDNILDLVRGQAIPPVSVVPSSYERWYRPMADHQYWPTFISFLSDKDKGGFPKKARNSINEASLKILDRIPNPELDGHFQSCGLVMGHVQSGKTANYTALIAKAADCGYNLVIVLSGGNFNDLRNQTQSRLSQQLTGQLEHNEGHHVDGASYTTPWHEGTSFRLSKDEGDVGQVGWDPEWTIEDGPCLIVTKKNSTSLNRLRRWADSLDGESVNLLLIDDEADHASINTEIEKEGTAINKNLRRLLHIFPRRVYIGYTATPFANVFVHPDVDGTKDLDEDQEGYEGADLLKTLYPRDFIVALPRPEGYLGLAELFGDEKEWGHWVSEVGDEEAQYIRRLTDKTSRSQELQPGIEDAIMDFILTWALRMDREGNSNFHHTMLVHTKETQETMHPLVFRISNKLRSWTHAIQAGKYALSGEKEIQVTLEKRFQNEYESKWEFPHPCPSFDKLMELFLEEVENRPDIWPDVIEVSSNPDYGDDIDYHQHDNGRVLVTVGGNRLSRGFTLEGLTVSYFIRHPVELKADTLLQQGRWFGHRHKYSDLVRIHTTEELRGHFHSLLLVEEFLRDELDRLERIGGKPIDYAISVHKAVDMIPTAMNKIPSKVVKRQASFSGEYLPKSGSFYFDRPDILRSNLEVTAKFLAGIDANHKHEKIKGRRLWDRVLSPEEALEFLSNLELPGNPFKLVDLNEYANRRKAAGRGEISEWSVALVGTSRGQQSDPLGTFGYNAPLVMSGRNKNVEGSNSIGGPAHGPADFRLDLPGPDSRYRPNGVWSPALIARAREPDNPLLLIYVFDPNYEASSGKFPLFEKGQEKIPVVGAAVIFPEADIPEKELELEREFWSNAYIENLIPDT